MPAISSPGWRPGGHRKPANNPSRTNPPDQQQTRVDLRPIHVADRHRINRRHSKCQIQMDNFLWNPVNNHSTNSHWINQASDFWTNLADHYPSNLTKYFLTNDYEHDINR